MASVGELRKGFTLEDWQVLPDRGLLVQGEAETHIEPLPMDVLVVLASRSGEVVSKDDLVQAVWHGRPVSDEVITRCISIVRRALGDDARAPLFVENVPRRGYRLMRPVALPERVLAVEPPHSSAPSQRKTTYLLPLLGGFVGIGIIMSLLPWPPLPWRPRPAVNEPVRSVVVLPFGCHVEKEYLCFGFSEALTTNLFRLQNLRVVKGRDKYDQTRSARDIVSEFVVDAFIEGQVRHDGRRFTVVADLIDGRNGEVLFSNVYDGDEERIYELQEKVATDVRKSISGTADRTPERINRPASFAVFDRFAEGLYEFDKRSADGIRSAIPLFQQAIDMDPHFGQAYLLLSYAYALLPEYSNEAQDPLYERAVEVVDEGVGMDPSITYSSATIYAFIAQKRGQWIDAERNYRRALAGDSVFPITHQLYSQLLASVGRLDASLEQARYAREGDPQSAALISRLAIANFWVDNLDDADRLFARADSMNLQAPIQDLAYALFRIRQGRVDEARRLAKAGLEKYGADNRWVDPVFDGIENPQLRDRAYALVSELSASGQLPPRVEITLWAILQDADRAMQVAWRLQTEGEIFEAELLFIPQFSLVRRHPDFPRLLDAIGVTAYWNEVNCRWMNDAVQCGGADTR